MKDLVQPRGAADRSRCDHLIAELSAAAERVENAATEFVAALASDEFTEALLKGDRAAMGQIIEPKTIDLGMAIGHCTAVRVLVGRG